MKNGKKPNPCRWATTRRQKRARFDVRIGSPSLEYDEMQTNFNARIDFVTHAVRWPRREVNVTSWLQVDTLAPQQYQQAMRGTLCREPERELMLAVLKDAIYCFQRYASARDKIGTRLYLEARKWLLEEDDDWPFSFTNICSASGLSSQHLRAGLLRCQETRWRGVTRRTRTHAQQRHRDKQAPSKPRYQTAPA